MSDNKSNKLSRRSFIEKSAISAAGLTLVPSFKGFSANDNINIGFIGMGRQAMFLLNGFIGLEGIKVVAGSDVYGVKRQRFEKRVGDFYKEKCWLSYCQRLCDQTLASAYHVIVGDIETLDQEEAIEQKK